MVFKHALDQLISPPGKPSVSTHTWLTSLDSILRNSSDTADRTEKRVELLLMQVMWFHALNMTSWVHVLQIIPLLNVSTINSDSPLPPPLELQWLTGQIQPKLVEAPAKSRAAKGLNQPFMFLVDLITFCSAVVEAMVREAARKMLLPCFQNGTLRDDLLKYLPKTSFYVF